MNAVGYIRMSDPDQDLSPEQQKESILKYAAEKGFQIVNWYEDHGRSAWKKKVRRPRYEAMLRDLRSSRLDERGVGALLMWKMNRLGRRMNVLAVMGEFEDAGIEVLSVSEAWPADKKFRKLLRTLMAMFNEMYCDNLSEDVSRGMGSEARKGNWQYGAPPLGFRPVKHDEGESWGLEPDPATAWIIELIFQMRVEDGDGARKIAERLTVQRVGPRRLDGQIEKQLKFTDGKVLRILRNPAYKGAITFKGEIVCEKAHQAIVSPERWEAAQRAMRRAKRSGKKKNAIRAGERGVYTPWLRCSACGGPVCIRHGGSEQRRIFYYRCSRSTNNREHCEGFRVRVDHLDPILDQALRDAVATPDDATRLVEVAIERLQHSPEGAEGEKRRRLEADERALTRKIKSNVRLYEDEDVEYDDVRDRLKTLRAQREAVRAELADLPPVGPLPRVEDVDVVAFVQHLLDGFNRKPVLERRKALKLVLDKVDLDSGGLATLHLTWRDPVSAYDHQPPYGPP